MAVALWDVMRPTALLGGTAAVCAPQTGATFGLLTVTAIASLTAGILAFHLSNVVARHMPTKASEASFAALYVATFVGIGLSSYFGGYVGAWALHSAVA